MKRPRKNFHVPSHEMEQYNMVTRKNSIIPMNDLTKLEKGITLYFNREGDLIIAGTLVGTDLIFWLSFTKTEDRERNEAIFNHIANDELERASYLHKVLEQNEIPYAVLEEYYAVYLKCAGNEEMAWETPFGHFYEKGQIENNGMFFAKDVAEFVQMMQKRCEIRECNGRYEELLKEYYAFLQAEEEYTLNVKTLWNLLEEEEYLRISSEETVRNIYKECRKRCSTLYNEYVTKKCNCQNNPLCDIIRHG